MIFRFFISDLTYQQFRECDSLRRLCSVENDNHYRGYWYYYTVRFETLLEFLKLAKQIGLKLDVETMLALQHWLEHCLATISNPVQSDCYFTSQWRA